MKRRVDSFPLCQVTRARYFYQRLGGCIVALVAIVMTHDPFTRGSLAVLAVGSLFDDGSVPGWFVLGLSAAVLVGCVVDVLRGFFFLTCATVALCAFGLAPFVRRRVPVIDLCAMGVVVLLVRSWLGLFAALAVLVMAAGAAVLLRRARFPMVPYAAVAAAVIVALGA